MDFFLYLQDNLETRPYHANQIGMRLSEEDLYSLTIVVDGEGSSFLSLSLMIRMDLCGFLKNWVDASEDIFDSSNVYLSLNIAHPLFEQIKGGKTKSK